MDEIEERFGQNLDRVRNMIAIYQSLVPARRGRRNIRTVDVLRAATVFLHAALEELMRGLILWKLPYGGETELNAVALPGTASAGRPEKFFLGKLAAFRAVTVHQLISNAVEEYANTLNINNTTDLSNLLSSIGVAPAAVNSRFPDLNTLMQRRHLIVHQADRQLAQGQGHHRARSLGVGTVAGWLEAVEEFGAAVIAQMRNAAG